MTAPMAPMLPMAHTFVRVKRVGEAWPLDHSARFRALQKQLLSLLCPSSPAIFRVPCSLCLSGGAQVYLDKRPIETTLSGPNDLALKKAQTSRSRPQKQPPIAIRSGCDETDLTWIHCATPVSRLSPSRCGAPGLPPIAPPGPADRPSETNHGKLTGHQGIEIMR